ncbi:hypothetical protein H5410_004718 [Solanum commersonii]|uniref:Uncharacterized protein n=1 Tax=Solanum commersonii TaxID=4109 RepID=A0A9J6A5M6_SOLCO|nr:hypothetical protein H5410_004718 [Solanum commersonii]
MYIYYSRRSTCNDEVILDVPGDQIHLKKVYISYNINYKALRRSDQRNSSRRSTCNDEVFPNGGNIASKLFDELSHSSFHFDESKNSVDFSISTKVNSLMVDTTDVDEKFTIMEQTIEALKKSIDDKNLQISQLMSKLDLYNSGVPLHNLTTQEKITIDSLAKSVDSQRAKQSTSFYVLWHRQIEEDVIILQFGSFEPVKVSTLKKTTNTSKVDDFSNEENGDTWTLVALRRQKHQGTSKLRLSKVDTKSSTNQLLQCKIIKSNTKSKYINASPQRVRRIVTLMEFFPEILLDMFEPYFQREKKTMILILVLRVMNFLPQTREAEEPRKAEL